MALASIKQRSAAVIRTVFIAMAHSAGIVSLEIGATGREARYDALRHFMIVVAQISSAREETPKLYLFRDRIRSNGQASASYFFWQDFMQISYSVLHVFPG
jgi:hypothetical protein